MPNAPRRSRAHYRGCLLAGAVGDALGAPVEFDSLADIRREHGRAGIIALAPAYGRAGAITDDTQMTLFTAEGLLRGSHRAKDRGIVSVAGSLHRSYLRWLATQGEAPAGRELAGDPSWLVANGVLHARRAPGNTCLAALRSGEMGTPTKRINDSKGCGGVMRVAPVGLATGIDPFEVGCEAAAITHGHPTSFLAAGAFAQLVAELARGRDLLDASEVAVARLAGDPEGKETRDAVHAAVRLAREGDPSPERIESLGGGWIAEEALAIGVYCALVARDLEHGLLLAVNHSGDSDSTGSITGNLLGLVHGERAIPRRWLEQLEARDLIATVADDLCDEFGEDAIVDCKPEHFDRYPPN